jgi:inner membrane protein
MPHQAPSTSARPASVQTGLLLSMWSAASKLFRFRLVVVEFTTHPQDTGGERRRRAMMAGSHVVLGGAAWLAGAPLLGEPVMSPLALGLAVSGALLPDVDHPKSWVGRRLRPVSTVLGKLLGHRGFTHSLAAVAGCCWLLLSRGVPRAMIAPLVVGYLSHLAGDLLTPGGLRLAWPLKGTWALPICRSGSPVEPFIVAAVLAWVWYGTAVGPWAARQIQQTGACDEFAVLRHVCPRRPVRTQTATLGVGSVRQPTQLARRDATRHPPGRKAEF